MYSPGQLKQFALRTLQAKDEGDLRYLVLLGRIMQRTGLAPVQIERKIEELADA